jgi:hypothetical protein
MSKVTGKQLAAEFGIDVAQALYRKTGDWYHLLTKFPAALFDEDGYIFFPEERDYREFVSFGKPYGIAAYEKTNTLALSAWIAEHPKYVVAQTPHPLPEEIASNSQVREGATLQVVVNRYERDRSARRRCVKKYGCKCSVCDFDFGETFGEMGEGFIHVHHLKALSSIKAEYVLCPERDLRPVCPNCHAMLHQRKAPYSIDELRSIRQAQTTIQKGAGPSLPKGSRSAIRNSPPRSVQRQISPTRRTTSSAPEKCSEAAACARGSLPNVR